MSCSLWQSKLHDVSCMTGEYTSHCLLVYVDMV